MTICHSFRIGDPAHSLRKNDYVWGPYASDGFVSLWTPGLEWSRNLGCFGYNYWATLLLNPRIPIRPGTRSNSKVLGMGIGDPVKSLPSSDPTIFGISSGIPSASLNPERVNSSIASPCCSNCKRSGNRPIS